MLAGQLKAPTITINQVHNGNSLIIEGTLNQRACNFTVDTGASRTIIRPELLKRTILWQTETPAYRLQTATGQPVSVLGDTEIEFKIGDQVYTHSALIANITDDCILGLDFLRNYRCVLDIDKGVLKFPDQEVFLQGINTCNLYCLKDTTLAPRTETLVEVKFPKKIRQRRCVMVEDIGRHPELITARTLVMTKGRSKVRIVNLGKKEIQLKKNSVVGRCEEVKYLRQINTSSVKQDAIKGEPDHIQQLLENSKSNLSVSELQQAKEFLLRFRDIFATGKDCGRTGLVKHEIDTGDARPIKQRPRRIPWAKETEVAEMVKDMADSGIIEPSTSPWSSPVVLVKKKDGSTRFCVDYRMLNDVTKKDSYPLPRIDDTLDMLSGMKWFSTIDLKSGYWQVEISEKDKEKTAFSTGIGNGLWQFNVMPFGLCNAPATFERLMDRVMVGLLGDVCLVYLDDVIIMGRTFKEHLRNMEKVFTRIRGANLKLSPKKCALFKKEVSYLGHVICADGVRTDPEKIKAVQQWPAPKNKTEVRAFLGLCTYYRRFVMSFSDIAKPLHQLTEDKRDFIWDKNCESAFNELKQRLCEAPILGYPSRDGRFVVDTDASNTGIGGVLSQVQEDRQVVIAYFSKALSKPERNYCVTRRELLAVVKTLQHFHKYLIGRQFTLRTDHAALKWLLQFKNPEGQVARWLEQLQEFNFVTEHRSGKGHNNADALSRRPCNEDCRHCQQNEAREHVNLIRAEGNFKKSQEEDDDIRPILDWKRSGTRPQWNEVSSHSPVTKSYWAQWDSLVLENDVLCRKWESNDGKEVTTQVIVPRREVVPLLQEIHDGASGGHLGIKKTLLKVRQRYYWLNCREDIEQWCRKCTACASVKGPQTRSRGKLQLYNVGAPWERIAIDVAGPFPVTDDGNKYIVVIQDYFTKWPEVFAIPNQEATTVAKKVVEEVVCRYGAPLEIHSDQGRNFESALFQEMCTLLGIYKTRTTPAHPQSDGMVERFNQTLENHLAKVVDDHQKDWDRYIPLFLMSYRSAVHDSTGHTPARVNFGREMRLPVDTITGVPPDKTKPVTDFVSDLQDQLDEVHKRVRENSLHTSVKMKTRYDRNANAKGFEEGALVWLHNPLRRKGKSPKLQARWEGPYTVIKRINDVTYRIKKGLRGKPKVVHVDRLAPYHGSNNARDEHD